MSSTVRRAMHYGLMVEVWSGILASPKTWLACGAALALVTILIWAAPGGLHGTNCGGNSRTLSVARRYALDVWANTQDASDGTFRVRQMSEKDARDDGFLNSQLEHYRVYTGEIRRTGPRQVVAFCDHAYGNVPARWFHLSFPLTHAVSYSDGTTGFLSDVDICQLDLTRFVEISRLLSKP